MNISEITYLIITGALGLRISIEISSLQRFMYFKPSQMGKGGPSHPPSAQWTRAQGERSKSTENNDKAWQDKIVRDKDGSKGRRPVKVRLTQP